MAARQASKQPVELQDVSNFLGHVPEEETASIDALNAPSHAVDALQKWNQSKSNVFKILATFFSFIIMGANDAAYGAIIPYLSPFYNITYTVVSLVFLSPLVGYVTAACCNNYLHKTLGQRGIAMIGPLMHVAAYTIIAAHPPFPVLVVAFILAGFGNGILDAAWNAWIGNLVNPNELLGFLHGFYGVGAVIAPLSATALITRAQTEWYFFYYIMIALAAVEFATSTAAFWQESGAKFRAVMSDESARGATRAALKTRVAWISSVFLLVYVGIEVSIGGWIVQFMLTVRDGGEFESGLTATGFWLGITMGRVVLGFVTPRIGENFAICLYLVLAMGLQLLFWLVPSFVVSSVAVAFIGFMMGPLFPAVVVATTKLLPAHLHVPAIGFAAAFGGSGAAVLPFVVGVIAEHAGVRVLQPIILALLGVSVVLWTIGMPRISPASGSDDDKMKKVRAKARNLFLGCFTARL